MKIRRVVTGHDKDGKAIVLSDAPAPVSRTHPLRPGHVSTDLWKTHTSPVPISDAEADPTLVPGPRFPTPQGTVFRISEVPPDTDAIRNLTAAQTRELYKAYGNEKASTHGGGGRHPMMHRTQSIDYAVVLQGEITLVLDEMDVPLKAGDVVIQRGTNHAWSNRSGEPCRMLYVLIDGAYDPSLLEALERAEDKPPASLE